MFIGVGLSVAAQGGYRQPAAGNPPVNTVAPVASGTFATGETVSCTTGTWTSDAGSIVYAYQWVSDFSSIPEATSATYVLTASDVLAVNFYCIVSATNDVGTGDANSNNIAIEPP